MKSISSRKLRTLILTLVAVGATFIAHTSANACALWYYHQPKIPKSLIKVD